MELPKNVTQIGEPDRHCKIYVEDYVISYLKQLNGFAKDKEMAVGLFGRRQEEDGVAYLFLYGACRLNFLQRESRHLSQAVQQEAEELRQKHFPQYAFLGYRLLNGEMIEGFHVCEQGACRYIQGYAQFYEKNDGMLAFMLEDRKEEARPEEVDQGKYEEVKKRQEERRQQSGDQGGQARALPFGSGRSGWGKRITKKVSQGSEKTLRTMKYTAAAVFVLLLAAGFATMGKDAGLSDLRSSARQMMDQFTAQKLPDTMEAASHKNQAGSIVTEDKLTEAIVQENESALQAAGSAGVSQPSSGPSETSAAPALEPTPETSAEPTQSPVEEPTEEPAAEATEEPVAEPVPEPTPEPTPEPVSYTVKRGDTLIGICLARYGSDKRVAEICVLNGINDPDDIKEGQKILLP